MDTERHRAESRSERKFDLPTYQRSLEELEMEFKSEALELARIRDQEEDEENNKHREVGLTDRNFETLIFVFPKISCYDQENFSSHHFSILFSVVYLSFALHSQRVYSIYVLIAKNVVYMLLFFF